MLIIIAPRCCDWNAYYSLLRSDIFYLKTYWSISLLKHYYIAFCNSVIENNTWNYCFLHIEKRISELKVDTEIPFYKCDKCDNTFCAARSGFGTLSWILGFSLIAVNRNFFIAIFFKLSSAFVGQFKLNERGLSMPCCWNVAQSHFWRFDCTVHTCSQ